MKLIVRNNIPAAPALSTPPSPIETGLQARITALEQVQTEITTQAERGWGRGPGWVLFALMILFLAGTVTFGLLYGFTPSKSEIASLKAAAVNAEVAADKARVEAGQANSALLTKDAQLTAAKEAVVKALADKANAEKEASEAKSIAKTATDKLVAIEKEKAEVAAKAIADAAAAEKAAMVAKLAELAKKLEEKAAMPAPQVSPVAVVTEKPATSIVVVPASTDGVVRGGHNPVGWQAALKNLVDAAEARKDSMGHAAFVAALKGNLNADQKAFLAKLAGMKQPNDPDKGYLLQAIAASGGQAKSGSASAKPGN